MLHCAIVHVASVSAKVKRSLGRVKVRVNHHVGDEVKVEGIFRVAWETDVRKSSKW